MGILDRIAKEQDQRLMEETTRRLDEERTHVQNISQLNDIVKEAIKKLADSLEEEFEEIIPGSYFRIGDIIIMVEPFQNQKDKLPDPKQKHELIIMEYFVCLMGIDKRNGRLDRIRIGTLKFLGYDSFYKTITEAPTYMELNASAVMKARGDFEKYFRR
jgi:hypothetical protein